MKKLALRLYDAYNYIFDSSKNPLRHIPDPPSRLFIMIILATMWAISDFRADNGATLVVPGSHKWPDDRIAEPDEITSAEMPAGAMFFWLGGTLHGGGANTSLDWRYGVILTYSLGWVRQEENQYLNVPKHILETLTPEQRSIAGFDMYRALGFYDPRIK